MALICSKVALEAVRGRVEVGGDLLLLLLFVVVGGRRRVERRVACCRWKYHGVVECVEVKKERKKSSRMQ